MTYHPTDAGIVYVTGRTLTMLQAGIGVYHYPAHRDYRTRTWCGRTIWSNDQADWGLVPMRRDIASCFARVCERCEAMHP